MVRMFMLALSLALLVAGAGTAAASVALAYVSELLPDNVVPGPVEANYAWGQATLIVDENEEFYFLTLNFYGLESPQTSAELLQAAGHEPGTSLVALPLGSYFAQRFVCTEAILEALENEELAIQIADLNYPGGAIRGNFIFRTVAVDEASWSTVKNLFN